ncbi:hypothetical protein EDB87DRAFT_1670070 [Lactarius vividus]|nr:hypothetical protein EDB87DRAFT_1670070 [Lactarius vividus]
MFFIIFPFSFLGTGLLSPCRISPLSRSVIAPEVRPKRGHSKDNSHFFLPPSFGVEHLRLRTHLGPSPSLQRQGRHFGDPQEIGSR